LCLGAQKSDMVPHTVIIAACIASTKPSKLSSSVLGSVELAGETLAAVQRGVQPCTALVRQARSALLLCRCLQRSVCPRSLVSPSTTESSRGAWARMSWVTQSVHGPRLGRSISCLPA